MELSYSKVMWWTKSLSICSIITDVALKKDLKYYLNIIPAISFLICYQPFVSHMAYASIRCYLINNLYNNNIDSNKEKWIYGEMHTANW